MWSLNTATNFAPVTAVLTSPPPPDDTSVAANDVLNTDSTGVLIVPSSTSPILAVPATVLNQSGARNIKSPANSCIVCPFTHPMFLVTGVTAKLLDDVPDSLNILS